MCGVFVNRPSPAPRPSTSRGEANLMVSLVFNCYRRGFRTTRYCVRVRTPSNLGCQLDLSVLHTHTNFEFRVFALVVHHPVRFLTFLAKRIDKGAGVVVDDRGRGTRAEAHAPIQSRHVAIATSFQWPTELLRDTFKDTGRNVCFTPPHAGVVLRHVLIPRSPLVTVTIFDLP